jgi:hypothetical protein
MKLMADPLPIAIEIDAGGLDWPADGAAAAGEDCRQKLPILIEVSAAAGVGLFDSEGIESDGLLRFAKELRRRSSALRVIRTPRQHSPTISGDREGARPTQYELPFTESASPTRGLSKCPT